jgi:hypothetical protein
MAVHASFGFLGPVGEGGEALSVTVETMNLPVIGPAKIVDAYGDTARLTGARVEDESIWSRVAGHAFETPRWLAGSG